MDTGESILKFDDENEQIELKKSTGELKEAIASIVAILNKMRQDVR